MGIIIMHGPGKGGPGKTTTTLNLGAALALEFFRERVRNLFRQFLVGARSDPGQQTKLEERLLSQIITALLVDQGLTEENLAPIFLRNGVAEYQEQLIPRLIEEQGVNEICIIEMDAQLNTTKGFGLQVEPDQKTVYDVLMNPWAGIEYAVRPTLFGVDILQARGDLYGVETVLLSAEEIRREYRLDDALRQAEGTPGYPILQQAVQKYRVLLIDPPPTLGLITLNAMTAADYVVAVIDMGAFSVDALDQLHPRLTLAQRLQRANHGHDVRLAGIVCNNYKQQTGYLDQCVAAELQVRQEYGEIVFKTVIPMNPRIFDSPTFKLPVQYNDPRSAVNKAATAAYTALAKEYIERFSLIDIPAPVPVPSRMEG